MPKTPKQIIQEARDQIANQPSVPKGTYSEKGCLCATAALGIAGGCDPSNLYSISIMDVAAEAVQAVALAIDPDLVDAPTRMDYFETVVVHNDSHGRDGVLVAFDRAIEAAA
jgi:hypothetical protein